MTLLEQLATDAAAIVAEYRKILARDCNPEPTDAGRIKELVRDLGLSAAQVKDDIAAMRTAQRLEQQIVELPALEQQRATITKVSLAFHAETKRIESERAARQSDFASDGARLDVKIRRLDTAKRQLVVHRQDHPRIFGDVGKAATAAPDRPDLLRVAAVLEPPADLVGPAVGGVEGEYDAQGSRPI